MAARARPVRSAARPSPHLTWAELACQDGTPYPQAWRGTCRLVALTELFEQIRVLAGRQPIRVLSAYRTPAHNRRIGGARQSQHLEGRALDLRPPAGWTARRFHDAILQWSREDRLLDLGGLGRYRRFVHVDTRPGTRLYRWEGRGVKDDR